MDLDLHLLDLRFETLRAKHPAKERRLMASLAASGQQLPVVVVAGETTGRFALVDGYKRVRALRQLHADIVRSTLWDLEPSEALLLERLMRTADSDGPVQQGWLLAELQQRFGLSHDELARRFGKSISWVSRRLGLIRELPESIQRAVREGELCAHVAARILVPLARANRDDACRLAEAIARAHLSSREAQRVYAGYLDAAEPGRELILAQPKIFLRAQQETALPATHAASPIEQLAGDLDALAGIARRARRRLDDGRLQRALVPDREHVAQVAALAKRHSAALFERIAAETQDAGRDHA